MGKKIILFACLILSLSVLSCKDKRSALVVTEITAQKYERLTADSCSTHLSKETGALSQTNEGLTLRTSAKELKFLNGATIFGAYA